MVDGMCDTTVLGLFKQPTECLCGGATRFEQRHVTLMTSLVNGFLTPMTYCCYMAPPPTKFKIAYLRTHVPNQPPSDILGVCLKSSPQPPVV